MGTRGFFFLLFAAKIERRNRDRDEPEKNPLVTIAASPLNFRRKQQKKKPSGTQGTGTSAEWTFTRGRKVNFGVQEPFALFKEIVSREIKIRSGQTP